jgi:GNAT superfamily N-acetyltransferase
MKVLRVPPDDLATIDALHAILAVCGRELHLRFGLAHWDPPYPLEQLREEAGTRALYAVRDENDLPVATFTLGPTPIPAYPASLWTPGSEPALYLNRLAVLPSLQGRGLGRLCMQEIESLARAGGYRALRFDALFEHPTLGAFYRSLGYAERGPFQIGPWPVVCFERVL